MVIPTCERRVFGSLGAFVQVTLTDVRRTSPIPIIHVSVKEGTRPYLQTGSPRSDHSSATA